MSSPVERFVAIAHEIVWCTLCTVDTSGRPRSRVVHPVWEEPEGRGLTGWLTTRSVTPKLRHIAATPYVSCSYWWEKHDVAVAECHAQVIADPGERERVWAMVAAIPAPAGFDPATIWPGGPRDPGFMLVRMRPWLLRFARADTLAAGGAPEVHRLGGATTAVRGRPGAPGKSPGPPLEIVARGSPLPAPRRRSSHSGSRINE